MHAAVRYTYIVAILAYK